MSNESWISDKLKFFFNSKENLERLAKREVESILKNKKSTRIFDDIYSRLYSKDDLALKRFVNVGPGSFSHKYWTNVDKSYDGDKTWSDVRQHEYRSNIDISWDMLDRIPFPIEDGVINCFYSSHVIEHVWDSDVDFLLQEAYRILKPGGVIRLVTPDADLAVDSLMKDDWMYLGLYYWKIEKKRDYPEFVEYAKKRLGFFLLDQYSLVTHPDNNFHLKWHECEEFLQKYSTPFDALSEASRLSDREVNARLGRHVNWFNYAKLSRALYKAGFSFVFRSSYAQSKVHVMKDVRLFDKTDPEMSLYVEAIK